MAARTLPNIGLTAYWPLGDDTWKDGMDANLFALSVLGQLVASQFVTGEPAGAQGMVVLTKNAAPIGIYDNGAWHYINAKLGWRAWVVSENALHVWDGDSWEPVTSGGGGGGSGLPPGGAPGQVLVKTGGADGVAGWDNLSGKSAYQVAVDNGFVGNQAAWLASLHGAAGESAYQVALDNGFVGSQAAWLATLHGADGEDSTVPGPAGLGVPAGGDAGQVLAKVTNADNDTHWIDPPAGGGGGGGAGSIADQNAGFIDPLPVAAHRYWRMRVPVELEGGDAKYFPGFDFLDENMVPFPGQNWTAREGDRAYMQAGDPGGYVGFGGAPFNITTDLGSAKRLGGMSITPRWGPFQDQAVHNFYMEGSDDNATWITYALVRGIAQGSGEKQLFRIRPFIVRFQNASAGGPSTGMEIAYAAATGGPTLTQPASDPLSRGRMRGINVNNPRPAFDGTTAGSDPYFGEAADYAVDYAFDNRPSLASLRFTVRSVFFGQGPSHFQLQASRDGINFTTFYNSAAGMGWATDNETRTFALPDLRYNGLPDTSGHAGEYLQVNSTGTGTRWAKLPFKVPFFATVSPLASEVLSLVIADEAFTFPAAFAGSVCKTQINPGASYTMTVTIGGTLAGTITISAAGVVAFATVDNAAKPVAVGDVVAVIAPAVNDTTITNVVGMLRGLK